MTPADDSDRIPERLEHALGQLHSPAVSAAVIDSSTPRRNGGTMCVAGRDGQAMFGIPAGNHYRGCMSPQLTYGRHRGPAPWTARRAAVLALLVRRPSGWHIPLAVRPETVSHHRGQIGLPGGQIELNETSEQAALREFEEELGVRPTCRLLGQLPSCYVFASNFEVAPWIAVTDDAPDWVPCPTEVERVVEMPLTTLLDPKAVDEITIVRGALTFQAPCYRLGEDHVWGATAVMLDELAALLDVESSQPETIH